MSGDFNTGLGNSILSMALMLAYCRLIKLVKFDFLVDGDDCLLFCERADSDRARSDAGSFARWGFDFELLDPVDNLEGIVFGRSQLVDVDGYRLVRDYRRAISTSFVSHMHYEQPKGGRRLAATIARAEWNTSVGVPILGAFYYAATKALAGSRLLDKRVLRYQLRTEKFSLDRDEPWREPTAQARRSFWLATGVDYESQIHIEQRLAASVAKCDFTPMLRPLGLPMFSDGPEALCFAPGW
jgi:hypothetical protein